MKTLLIIIVLTSLTNILLGQDFKILKPNLDDSCDVINEIQGDEFEQIIYIDKKVNSSAKDRISNFHLSDWSLDQIKNGHSEVNKNKDIAYNTKHQPLPDKWIRIGRYNDKWILYNNPAFNIRYILTDSTIIRFVMDGVVFSPIINYRFENDWHLFDYLPSTKKTDSSNSYEIGIKIVDSENLISVWRFSTNDKSNYSIMIPEKNKTRFPILVTLATEIVHNGQDVLDKIDFDELIK